ncbi:unnamed protein product [Alopecurus aequalis]
MLMVTSKLLLFHLYATSYFVFYYQVPAADAADSTLSFSFDFSHNGSTGHFDDLRFEGNASLHDGLVDLTCNLTAESMRGSTGRMSYNHPVPFYRTATGEVASFVTQFNFAVRAVSTSISKVRGDGMAFFLGSYPSRLSTTATGGSLGLKTDGEAFNGVEQLVAVEFDTFKNTWDTDPYDHIAIDVGSVASSPATAALTNFSLNGSMTAFITFNGSTRMLVATLHFDDPSLDPVQVSTQLTNPVAALLPSVVAVGFSAATGDNVELHQIMSWSFNSTLRGEGNATSIIIIKVILPMALLVGWVLVWLILSWYRLKRTRDSLSHGIIGLKRFEYKVLAIATGEFTEDKKLGAGSFGAVYEGNLTDDNSMKENVAVKKLKKNDSMTKDFLAELKAISETSHINLVRLKGWCCRQTMMDAMCWFRQLNVELFLVYELVPNGNLDYHLNGREVLSWPTRYKIVKGIASALHYLHHVHEPYILHRDIKPSNILLDDGFNAKLADFGLSRIANHNSTTLPTLAMGTTGYMDPQCMKNGLVKYGRHTDVYSFGIVLLDIACTDLSRQQVWELYRPSAESQVEAIADARLRGVFDRKEMERVVVLGLMCSDPDRNKRPSMHDAMQFLEDGTELPNILTKKDDLGYLSITVNTDEEALAPYCAGSSSDLGH